MTRTEGARMRRGRARRIGCRYLQPRFCELLSQATNRNRHVRLFPTELHGELARVHARQCAELNGRLRVRGFDEKPQGGRQRQLTPLDVSHEIAGWGTMGSGAPHPYVHDGIFQYGCFGIIATGSPDAKGFPPISRRAPKDNVPRRDGTEASKCNTHRMGSRPMNVRYRIYSAKHTRAQPACRWPPRQP